MMRKNMQKRTLAPSTRYLGSKLRISDWIMKNLEDIEFNSMLECFGGTGTIGYLLKLKGKRITYNDNLRFNYLIGKSIIENNNHKLSKKDVDFILTHHADIKYTKFIQHTFKSMYYTTKENQWLDKIITNIKHLNYQKKPLAYNALFQSCISKRPYNLFHRTNLYMRLADVDRYHGNKTTWDTPFETHFKKFVNEINSKIFDNNKKNKAYNLDVFSLPQNHDLVYIDSPYMSHKKPVNYRAYYHFLEGLANHTKWNKMIDYSTRTKELCSENNFWMNKLQIYDLFEKLIKKFQHSTLVISYKSNGIPNEMEMIKLLKKYKKKIIIKRKNHRYALSCYSNRELLFIAS